MKRKYKLPGNYRLIILVCVGLCILNMDVLSQSPINILPLGNSITFDYDSFDITNPRPDGDRISYRYTLFQLLHDAGYHFDYVGSENSGDNYFQDPEFDDNAGFPGIETWQLTDLINTGYNAKTGVYVTQGPYLNFYPAVIILLHIGTNSLIESASDVEALLDTIRSYDTDVIILVARIINRQIYHLPTNAFNNNVESMVNSRGDDRIIMVNMESGANINYATDMADNLHPNPAGYDKMAHKWFEAIDNLNHTPEIAIIPEQICSRGKTFPGISLDDFVYDMEDSDDLLSWTFTQQAGSHLEVSIDDNRILHVVPFESWHGSEIVKLRVEDSGSGTFRKKDSMEVLFTINDPPVITSLPTVTEIRVNEAYQYIMTATDVDDEDSLVLLPVTIPGWLSFTPGTDTAILFGFATENDIGSNSIVLMVNDGHYEVYQEFSLEVLSTAGILHDHIPVSRIYPNPTNNDIIIQNERAGIYSIEIASLNGQLIYSSELEGRSPHIDLSSFQKGTYFITIRSKEFVTTEKIIKL
jgi:hypothetical protein